MDGAIRAVVFDVDGVLVRPWGFRDLLAREHGITPEQTAPFFRGPFRDCTLGRADLLESLAPFLTSWGWTGTAEAFVETWLRAEEDTDPEVVAAVAALRARGLRCYVASQQERRRARHLEYEMGFGRLFDGLFFSCDLGIAKSEGAFFREAAGLIGEEPAALLFFDDYPGPVDAARAAGWRAERYTDPGSLRALLARHMGT